MINLKFKRVAPGYYTTTYKGREYEVFSTESNFGGAWETVWNCKAAWDDKLLNFDPVYTKRDAVDNLIWYLEKEAR